MQTEHIELSMRRRPKETASLTDWVKGGQLVPLFVPRAVGVLLPLGHGHVAHGSWGAAVVLLPHGGVGALSWAHELLTSCRET